MCLLKQSPLLTQSNHYFLTALSRYNVQRTAITSCVQFDEFEHTQTPVIPSPQSKEETYSALPKVSLCPFIK